MESTKKEDKRAVTKNSKWNGGSVDDRGTSVWMAALSLAKDRLGDPGISLHPTNKNLTLPKLNKLSKETHAI